MSLLKRSGRGKSRSSEKREGVDKKASFIREKSFLGKSEAILGKEKDQRPL